MEGVLKNKYAAVLCLTAFLTGCGGLSDFFKSSGTSSSQGVSAPGASYGQNILTCSTAQGSVSFRQKYSSSRYSGAGAASPLAGAGSHAGSGFHHPSQFGGQFSAGAWLSSGGGPCAAGPSGGKAFYMSGYIKDFDLGCPSGTIYFRCEGTAPTENFFCCSSGHVSCSSAVRSSTSTTSTGIYAFVPISQGQAGILPAAPVRKSKAWVALYFGSDGFGGSKYAGFYCRP